MRFDWPSRIASFIGLLAFAFVVSHQIHLRNEAIRVGSSSRVQPSIAPSAAAPAVAANSDPSSAAVSHPSKIKKPTVQPAQQIGNDNTLVNVPIPQSMGSGNTFVGPTDANGNTIYNKGGTAIGKGACADSTSIAIGSGANSGACAQPKPAERSAAPSKSNPQDQSKPDHP